MITRIATVPYPPLLVPELTVRSDPRIEPVRGACSRAVSSLAQSAPEWVAVGVDRDGPVRYDPEVSGTFAGFGVDVGVTLGESVRHDHHRELPLPALVAGWLRASAGARSVTAHLLAESTSPPHCADYGARLADSDGSALLVLAGGTRCRDERSPRPPDPRAEALDTELRNALAAADVTALGALDPTLCAELGVEARAALQVLAGAAEASGGRWSGELLYSGTPLGVTYHVAVWTRVGD